MTAGGAASQTAFGPYELRGRLGRGGTGDVYRAWDRRLERDVALKILRERSERDPERVQRFIAEARAASSLNHPNIVTVFDAAVDGDTPYLVAELIDGESLGELIRRGPVPIKQLLDLATQVADGLAEAHAAGIVHRDLKPDNVMVTHAGRAKILDFGLARPTGLRASDAPPIEATADTVAEPGLLAGTVPYMSPEQARGAATDARSDQFSFGLILYEMASGRPAFARASPAETLHAIATEEPAPLESSGPHLPLPLRWIIERCLAKRPGDRYSATADLHRDLRMLRDRLAETYASTARGHAELRPSRLVRATPWLLATAVLAAALLAASGGVPASDLNTLRFTPFATEAAYEGFPAWSPDGRTIAYAAAHDGVLQIFTKRLDSPTPAKLTSQPYDCRHPFWAPDGRTVYFVSLAGERDGIWAVGAAGGEAKNVLTNASRAAIAPDGRTLAFLRDEAPAAVVGAAGLWLTSIDGRQAPSRYDRGAFGPLRWSDGALAFSPDGRVLGISAVPSAIALESALRGWQFWVLPLAGGQPSRRLEAWADVSPRLMDFTWLSDSRHVVLGLAADGTSGSHLWMADLSANRAWALTRTATTESHPSASPTGTALVFTSDEPHYDLVEIPIGDGPMRALIATSRNESDAVWSPDRSGFAYVTDRTGADEIWLRSGEGPIDDRRLVTEADFADDDRTILLSSPSFSPDGQRLAYQRNAGRPVWPLRIWHRVVAGGRSVPLLPETHQGYQGAPTWSPDGQWIAFAEWVGGQWRLAKVRIGEGQEPMVLRTDGVATAAPQWSPDGDRLTWETGEGFTLVSAATGEDTGRLGTEQWLVHTWSPDGRVIYGVRYTDDLRLVLAALDVRTATARVLRDLGPSPPVNNPVKGLSVHPDGDRLITSLARPRGDLWLLEGFRPRSRWFGRLWSRGHP
jgi:Tol biopolymer transport system component